MRWFLVCDKCGFMQAYGPRDCCPSNDCGNILRKVTLPPELALWDVAA